VKKINNNVRSHATPILLSLFSAGLAGCSTIDKATTATTGVASKGLLDNAEVFIDVDGDGVWTEGVDSDKVRTEADGSFSIDTELTGDIVVQTDETTIDASSGAVLAGIKMSAMAGSSVVTVATTIANELVDSSGGTLSQTDAEAQVKAILGLDASTNVSSYNAYAAENAGTAESVAFEKAAQHVMTVINTLAEAEATSSIGSTVSKSAALNNAVAAFVDVIETQVADSEVVGADPLTAIDFTSDAIINEVVAAAIVNDAGSVFADNTFTTSLTSIKTAIQTVNKAIDAVTSLDSGSEQTFSVAQSSLIDMTQAVASTNDASKASIMATTTITDISNLVVVKGATAGLTAEDAASVTDTGSLVITGTALVADPDTADNVTYTFDTTVTSDSPIGALTITAEGVWTYTLDNNHADVQALGASGALVEVFQIKTKATDATDPDNLTFAESSTKFISIRVEGSNDTPTLSAALADVSTAEDASFSLTIPSATFADVDTGDTSTLTATLEGGAELPSWLTFTASTGVLSGTPTNDQVGSINITITSTDASKASVSDTFTITVTNTNDAPTVSASIVDQTIAEDSALSFTIPSATFADVDTGDSSTLTATLTGGGDLPSWLTFTATTGVFSGTPTNDEVGSININVTSTDGSTASVADTFNITVANVNDAPTVSAEIVDQTIAEDSALNFTIPSATFSDVDTGDTSTLTATLEDGTELPSWLTFTASTGVISGTPTNDQVGSINITVTSTDGNAASVSDTFSITVANVNDAPTVATALIDQTIAEDSALSFTIPSATFADVDTGDSSTLTATLSGGGDLPSWLTFTAATGVLSGTPTNDEVGSINITVTSTDTSAISVSDDFSLITTNINDAPIVTSAQAALETSENVDFSYTVPNATFGDIDVGDTLTYSATLTSGGALPAWLSFDASTKTFSGTPTNSDITDLSIKVTASDGTATVSDTLALKVTDNAVPSVTTEQTDQNATQGSAFTYTVPANTFADLEDVDSSLTITATDLPDGLTFTSGTISGTPTNAAVGANTVSITATDSGGAAVTDQITITVANINDAPTVANALIDQTIISGRESAFTIASDSFSDIDTGETDTLAYSVTLADGGTLPSWLTPNEDGTFTANPTTSDAGTISVTVTATDTSDAAISDTFDIIVMANQGPVIATLVDLTATEDTAVSFSLADDKFTDGNSDAITVTVSGNPSWLAFDASTKTFSGTPTTDSDAGTSTITVAATDASNATGTTTFDLVTTAVNDAPAFTSASSVNVTENSFTAAMVAVSDEESDTMTYTLAGTDASSFSIDSSTGKLSFAGTSRTDMNLLLDSSGEQGGLMVDNLTTTVDGGVTTLRMDLWVMPKVVDVEALKGIQFTPTSTGTAADFDFFFSSGDDSTLPKKHDETVDGEGEPIAGEYATVGGSGGANGSAAIWYSDSAYSTNDMEAIKIGLLKISNYDATNTYTIDTLLMGGGDAGVSTSANYTLNNLILSSVMDLPEYGDNASAAYTDSYSVEITATDSNDSTSSVTQTLSVTVDATTANINSSTTTATWTGTGASDTYTIDSLTASADGGDGDNDVAQISIANHTTWDTTGGTSELAATLVDMEIIDIGNVISSNDSSAVVIGDFSTNMTIDSASAASILDGTDSQVSIMGTTNDIVTLSGTDWVKSTSSSLSSGDYSSQVLDAWSDGSSILHIDHEINIVTPDIA
jgi:VCBS repeat-containing protein